MIYIYIFIIDVCVYQWLNRSCFFDGQFVEEEPWENIVEKAF